MEFYDVLADYYEDIFPLDNGLRQFALSLGIQKSDIILDMGCATGEFSFFLSQFADNVYGFDINSSMISKAVRLCGGCDSCSNPQFFVGDMLQLESVAGERKFNYIFCLGNTLVHLEKEKAVSVIRAAVDRLAPGGTFVFQIVNYDRIFRDGIHDLPLIESDRIEFKRSYVYGTERNRIEFHGKTTVKKTGEVFESKTDIYPLVTDELLAIIKELPFKTKEIFGGYNFQKCMRDSFVTIGILKYRI